MFCLPVIDEADYPAVAKILRPVLPRSYEGWLALSEEWSREHFGAGILPVPVDPDAFADYVSSAGSEIGLQTLLSFVAFNPWHDPDC